MSNIVEAAYNGRYSEFKKLVESEMAKKLQNHEVIKEYNRQMEYYERVTDHLNETPVYEDDE